MQCLIFIVPYYLNIQIRNTHYNKKTHCAIICLIQFNKELKNNTDNTNKYIIVLVKYVYLKYLIHLNVKSRIDVRMKLKLLEIE